METREVILIIITKAYPILFRKINANDLEEVVGPLNLHLGRNEPRGSSNRSHPYA